MKMENFAFWGDIFRAKDTPSEKLASTSPIEVFATAAAQPHVLQGKMKEKQLTHGETVMATLSPVRLESVYNKMAVYFCPMQTLDIKETIAAGDGGEIPAEVVIEGLSVPADYEPGLYSLRNVKLSSNGSIQVKTTAETTWEKV
jgi:hypothetical protein